MNFKDKIFKSSVYGIIGHVVRIGIAFMLMPFLLSTLGEEGYGLWLLIVATLGWFRFISFGFSASVQRSIAIAIEGNDIKQINSVFSCAIVLFSALGMVSAIALFSFSYFPQLLGVGEEHFNVVHVALMVLSLKIFWDMGMCSFHGFFSSLIRYDIDANLDLVNDVVKAVLIVALVSNYNIYGAIAATMVADVVTNILKVFYAKKIFPEFNFDLKLVSKREFKSLYTYSKHVVSIAIAESLSVSVDSLIISHILGLTFVAIYGVAARFVGFAETAFLVVLNTFLPVITRLIERKENIRPEMEQIFSLNLFLVAIFFTPLILFANNFIYLWLGEGFESGHIIVTAVSIAAICRAISRPTTQLLMAKAQHQKLSYVKLFGVSLNVVLSITLGNYFGLPGIAAATIISFYFTDALLHLFVYKYYTGYPISWLAFRFVLSNFLILGISYSGFYYLEDYGLLNWFELFLYGGITFFVSVLIFWFVSLDRDSKGKIIMVIDARLPEKFFLKKLIASGLPEKTSDSE